MIGPFGLVIQDAPYIFELAPPDEIRAGIYSSYLRDVVRPQSKNKGLFKLFLLLQVLVLGLLHSGRVTFDFPS